MGIPASLYNGMVHKVWMAPLLQTGETCIVSFCDNTRYDFYYVIMGSGEPPRCVVDTQLKLTHDPGSGIVFIHLGDEIPAKILLLCRVVKFFL